MFFFLLVLLAISWGLVSGGGLDLPTYISKCSLSDPKFNKCVIEQGNKAIPIIAKGDALYNIPPLSPLKLPEAQINGTDGLKFVLYNLYSDDWHRLVLTDIVFDLKNGKGSFIGTIDKLQGIAQNYTIKEGKILDISVFGHGKHNTTVVGVKINQSGSIRLHKKGDDEYLEFFDTKAEISCERAYFYFENMRSTKKSDVNRYINRNWKRFFDQIKAGFNNYVNIFINAPLQPIITAVPFNKIFLP